VHFYTGAIPGVTPAILEAGARVPSKFRHDYLRYPRGTPPPYFRALGQTGTGIVCDQVGFRSLPTSGFTPRRLSRQVLSPFHTNTTGPRSRPPLCKGLPRCKLVEIKGNTTPGRAGRGQGPRQHAGRRDTTPQPRASAPQPNSHHQSRPTRIPVVLHPSRKQATSRNTTQKKENGKNRNSAPHCSPPGKGGGLDGNTNPHHQERGGPTSAPRQAPRRAIPTHSSPRIPT